MKTDSLQTYIWLVELLYGAGEKGLLRAEIERQYALVFEGNVYNRRTFINHREAVRELFGIDIIWRKSGNRYYIANACEIDDPSRFRQWIVASLGAGRMVSEASGLRDRIVLEHNVGEENLPTVISAMRHNKKIEFDYGRRKKEHVINFRPYGLCQKDYCWRVAGTADGMEFAVYNLGMMSDIIVGRETFKPDTEWHADEFFAQNIGK